MPDEVEPLREPGKETKTRQAAAAAMAIHGASDREIAEQLGYPSARHAQAAWIEAIAGTATPEADYRAKQRLASARLDKLMNSLADKAFTPTIEVSWEDEHGEVRTRKKSNEDHLEYNNQYLRVLDRWIKLNGLDAPQVIRLMTPDAQEMERVVGHMTAMAHSDDAEEGDIFEAGEDGVYDIADSAEADTETDVERVDPDEDRRE